MDRFASGPFEGVRRRPLILGAVGLAILAVAVVVGVGAGSVAVPVGDTVGILAHRLLGLDAVRREAI